MGDYVVNHGEKAQVSAVYPDADREFLVVRFTLAGSKTFVFQRDKKLNCWVSRREINIDVEPLGAVTGYLLSHRDPDPIHELRRDLERQRQENWRLLNELTKLKSVSKAEGKKRGGGRSGRRNS